MSATNCGNCEAPLTGPYCAQCGQQAHHSARGIGPLFHDAWHDLTHVDGRVWATLGRLLLRPGQLTLDYFAEKRARYVPPFRLYLILSLAFFGLWSLGPTIEAIPDSTPTTPAKTAASAEVDGIRREARQVAAEARDQLTAARARDAAAGKPASLSVLNGDDADSWFGASNCTGKSDIPWLVEHAKRLCQRWKIDNGKTMLRAFVTNIPKMMFVFLPLIAAVMTLLYWFPRRYYVEHVVLVLHNHAALYLAMILLILLGALGRQLAALGPVIAGAGVAVFFYAIWYVYRSMRRYYGQGRWLTLLKLGIVSFAYLVFLGVTLLGTFVLSALVTA